MKKIIVILALALVACSLPVQLALDAPATPTPTATLFSPTVTPLAPPELGTKKNPLIMALAPAPHTDPALITAAEKIAAFIQERTGYRIVTTAPTSEALLVDALNKGNTHIALLSPFGYFLARENDSVVALMASSHNEQLFYGAQFVANRESEFIPFFDVATQENTEDALIALKQFRDKKACWSDKLSASGYVVPLGFLNKSKVQIANTAFLEGHASVIRAVYADDICDFGATYIDARQLPALEASYPDVTERVVVIWRIPAIIPYDNISTSNNLPIEMRRAIQRAFIDLLFTPDGKLLLQQVYGMDEIQIADESMYVEFEAYLKESGLKLIDLVE